jgi:cytoskeleton protein RodZ
MNSVGRILRSARERQGREVAEIADELCLTQQYLRAIEDDDVKNLPGTFFYKNFVKQYAAIVGVKDSEIRAGIEALTAAADEPVLPGALAHAPIRPLDPIVADGNRSYFGGARLGLSVGGLVVVLMACSGFYAWWIRPAERPKPQAPVIQSSVQSSAQTVSQSAPQNPSPAATATVQVSAEGQTQTVDGINQVVLNLSATEKTWLSVTSDGKHLFSGFLEPSQTKTLSTGVEAARMTVGNAGGLEVRLNGKPIGPIGKSGQVRVVVFTPDNFQVLPLDPPAPPSETL